LARPCRAEVRKRALRELGAESAFEVSAPLVREGVVVDAWPVRGERRSFALVKLLAELRAPGVVLCAAPHEVDAAFAVLSAAGVPCCRSHAGMPAPERTQALSRFLAQDQPALVLLTTSAVGPDSGLCGVGEAEDSEPRFGFGRAPTRSDLEFLLHYHAPASFEQYARELAWLGGSARAVTLYDSAARSLNDAIFEQQRLLGRHVQAFARLLAEAGANARAPTLEWLALQSGFSRRTSERIVALLVDAGAVRRQGKVVEACGSVAELAKRCEELGARLDALRAADRARLGAVERWAEGRECRVRAFAQYFGGELKACGVCAGCVAVPGAFRQEQRRSGGALGS
jgi:ATP-dependent DNA helicase RecQ